MPFQSPVAFSSAGFGLDLPGRKDNAWVGSFCVLLVLVCFILFRFSFLLQPFLSFFFLNSQKLHSLFSFLPLCKRYENSAILKHTIFIHKYCKLTLL